MVASLQAVSTKALPLTLSTVASRQAVTPLVVLKVDDSTANARVVSALEEGQRSVAQPASSTLNILHG